MFCLSSRGRLLAQSILSKVIDLLNQPWQLLSGDERQEHERLTLERQDHGRQDHEG